MSGTSTKTTDIAPSDGNISTGKNSVTSITFLTSYIKFTVSTP